MPWAVLLLAVGIWAPASAEGPEERLRLRLAEIRQEHLASDRQAVVGSTEALRDALANQAAPIQKAPVVPPDFCRELASCPEAPLALHVDDQRLIDEAFLAMAKPWLNLQKARGKDVSVSVDAGMGVRLGLQDLASQPVVTFEAWPAGDGFDVVLSEGARAAKAYAAQRAAWLAAHPASAKL